MTNHPSRKQFFAHLLGAAAAVTAAPSLLAKPATAPASAPEEKKPSATPAFPVKTDPRAVARGADAS